MAVAGCFVAILSGCGGGGGSDNTVVDPNALPQLSAAKSGTLVSCTDLAAKFKFANTTLSSVTLVPAGGLKASDFADSYGPAATTPYPEHCVIVGEMNRRTSAVDGQSYAIGFEMRLPKDWNGRFFYQANGGTDGANVTAVGAVGTGAAPKANALTKGFAVISSDAGHHDAFSYFGIDPQARLDYGYMAEVSLTPMAKSLIQTAYGRGPDRSYFAGCSSGGRHTMIAMTRLASEYDGFVAGNPGFHLPQAAVENIWKAQQYAKIATSTIASGANAGQPDISSAVNPSEFALVSKSIAAKCDALDGVVDGISADTIACQSAFDVNRDVPTCAPGAARDGTCLTAAQKNTLATIFVGSGSYINFFKDPGIISSNWVQWHYLASVDRDPATVNFIFRTPPAYTRAQYEATTSLKAALSTDIAASFKEIYATNSTYTQSAMQFMVPVNESNLSAIRARGAKAIIYHGSSDGIFSPADTVKWYDSLKSGTPGTREEYARMFLIPGMNHCGGGPTTDQFDMIDAIVNWVEKGKAPEQVIANARGAGANAVNKEVPATWNPARTRPLCPYPKVAKYNGTGDIESASSFTCK
jgi:feruloyl esterase